MFKLKRLSDDAVEPSRGSQHAAGYDLSSVENVTIEPRGRGVVNTGWAMTVPEGTYGRIAPRSGLAVKKGIDVGAGVIDRDYGGPVGVVLFNNSDYAFQINVGDRIAQLVLENISTPGVTVVDSLEETCRGSGGFGSTGV